MKTSDPPRGSGSQPCAAPPLAEVRGLVGENGLFALLARAAPEAALRKALGHQAESTPASPDFAVQHHFKQQPSTCSRQGKMI